MKNKFILAASALAVALASSAVAQSTVNTNNAASGGRAGPVAGTMGSTANSSANTTTRPGMEKSTPGSSPRIDHNTNVGIGKTTDSGANAVTDVNGNQAANRGGPVNTVLPTGMGSYTYYADANTYYNPRTKVYYYQQNGEWKAGTTSPQGVNLGKGRTVQLQGESNVNGAGK